MSSTMQNKASLPVIKRLPKYYRYLSNLQADGRDKISSSELAHTIEEMKTICTCGRKATCNGRKVNGEFVFEGAQVAIDTVDAVEYQSLCPQCWYREYRAFLKRHPAHQ